MAKAPHPPPGAGLGRGEAGTAGEAGEAAGLAGDALGLGAGDAEGLEEGEADGLAAGHDGCPAQTWEQQ